MDEALVEPESNQRAIRELLAAVDRGDLERVLSFYSPDYVDHDTSEARGGGRTAFEALRPAFAAFYAAFSETRHILDDLFGAGDRVAARISVEAVHVAPLFGIPPSGRKIRNRSIVIYRFADGKIVERWCREQHSTRELLLAAAAGAGSRPDPN
jgi:predicted ester cyclase